jgi:uncharacterized protein YtpQ (UPF0354 family)
MSFLKKLFNKPAPIVPEPLNREAFFHTHKSRLYPWVKVLVSDNEPTDETEPVHKRWHGDLVIMYVFDMDDRFQMLLKRDLPATISEEELHRLAIENLQRNVEFKVHQTNFGGYMVTAGGDHEAGVISIPGLWQSLADHIGDSLVVGIPSKDLVLIAPASDTDVITNLKILVHEIFKDGERLLTRNIFEYNKDQATWKIVDTIKRSSL